jgi:two-component system LytT family response regulator
MSKLNAILIDDERNSLEALETLIRMYCHDVNIRATCRSADEALAAIAEFSPDLLLLDIEMPGKSGFDLIDELPDKSIGIIFVTAYDQYAIDALRVSAMDYLLKPVDEMELVRAISRVKEKLAKAQVADSMDVLLTNLKSQHHSFQKLAIPTMEGLDFLSIKDILYCEAEGNYTHIFMRDGAKHLVSKTLRDISELLSGSLFIRVHQSYLINLEYVVKYIRGAGGQVIMADQKSIPVSRARKEELLSLIYKS